MTKLQEFRKSKGLSAEQFARELGYTVSLTAKVERGDSRASSKFMARLKQAFPDADINALFFEKE